MTLKKFIKKNTTLLVLAGVAVIAIGILFAILLSGTSSEQNSSQLANDQLQNEQQADGVNEGQFSQAQDAQTLTVEGGGSNCEPNLGKCWDKSDLVGSSNSLCEEISASCPGGSSQICCKLDSTDSPSSQTCPGSCLPETTAISTCDSSDGVITSGEGCGAGYLCCNYNEPPPDDDVPDNNNSSPTDPCFLNPATGNFEGDCPPESPASQLTCGELGGACRDQNAECSGGKLFDTVDCTFDTGQACCVPLPTPDDTIPDPPTLTPTGSGSQGSGVGAPGAPGVPGMQPDDPNNFCGVEVTCGSCDQDCASGPGKCQTCTSADPNVTCSFSQACESTPENPIYEFTCGGGSFLDETKKQRSFEEGKYPQYQVKECTGNATCEGGPNTDGLYWCVDVITDPNPSDPGDAVTCDVATDYNLNNSCPSGCAKWNKCTDGALEMESCVDASYCEANTPQPDPDPQDPAADPTDPANFPMVTNMSYNPSNGIEGERTKINVTIQGTADKYLLYLHGSTQPQEGDEVLHSYNGDNIQSNKFYFLGQTSTGKISFNAPNNSGPFYLAVNAINNGPTGGSSEGEIVCSWTGEAFERGPGGAIDIGNSIGDCGNGSLQPFSVQEAASSQGGSSNTSDPVDGMTITATTSPNCGGDVLLTWTRPNSNFPWKYYLYRDNSAGFNHTGTNMIEGPIGAPMTTPPYHDWDADPDTTYHYKVLAYDGGNGDNNLPSNTVSITSSPACGN